MASNRRKSHKFHEESRAGARSCHFSLYKLSQITLLCSGLTKVFGEFLLSKMIFCYAKIS